MSWSSSCSTKRVHFRVYLCVYIYADESDKGTQFANSEVKQRDAQMSLWTATIEKS